MVIENLAIDDVKPYEKNARTHPKRQIELLADNIKRFGFTTPILVDKDNVLIAGHGRLEALKMLGEATVPSVRLETLSPKEIKALRLADNQLAQMSEWDMDLVIEELKDLDLDLQELTGFDPDILSDLGAPEKPANKLSDKFLLPPFSVLNAREGAWQDRKRAWLDIGIKSELGRGEEEKKNAYDTGGLLMKSWTSHPEFYKKKTEKEKELGREITTAEFLEKYFVPFQDGAYASGTSIFDPVLCELMYLWFAPEKSNIIDPFAGGSVRGIVASKLGHQYCGTELRAEQVEANIAQAIEIVPELPPVWAADDAMNIREHFGSMHFDMMLTCPPYADLEVYSDDPRDISNMSYPEFIKAYNEIIKRSTELLKENSFAVCVVGEVRAKNGEYYNFVGDTITAFEDAGLHYYNEIILVTAIGSLPIRVGKQFSTTRKIGKTHQNILVFWKGDPAKAKETVSKWDIHGDIFADVSPDEESPLA